MMTYSEMEGRQRAPCRELGCDYQPTPQSTKVGFALGTQGQHPINGLRHPPEGETSGWYIWCGGELLSDADFFSPLHARHLVEHCPGSIRFLGLPEGYRFLVHGEYVDTWYDPKLLEV